MELQVGDRLVNETGDWEVISRPHNGRGKDARVRVQRVGKPGNTEIRIWRAHERVVVRRATAEEGKDDAPSFSTGRVVRARRRRDGLCRVRFGFVAGATGAPTSLNSTTTGRGCFGYSASVRQWPKTRSFTPLKPRALSPSRRRV
jgi:hypothetical protein